MKNKMIRIFAIISFLISFFIFFPDTAFGQGQIKRQHHKSSNNNGKHSDIRDIKDLSKKFNWDCFGICQDTIVDIGLSVKWAGWNIGASSSEQSGTLFGWGDPTGKETSIYDSKYPVEEPPMSIVGDRRYDMALVNWGWPWRLPYRSEFEELVSKCKWEYINYKGVNGFKLIGPNGNTLFLPITSYRSIEWDSEKMTYKDEMEITHGNIAHYYSGELNSNGGQWEAWDSRPFVLCGFFTSYAHGSVEGTGLRSTGYPVRAVYSTSSPH